MTLKHTSFSALATAALMAASSAITYLLCTERAGREIADLKEQVTKLQAAEREAIVTKRISEQMSDIAMEQRLVSDRQRERAEEQSRMADIERGKAELERGLAIQAQYEAVQAASQADSMRILADNQREKANRHMEEALAARAQADTSFYRSLGRSLAQTSIAQSGTQNRALAPLLAYSSYHFTKMYQGDLYQQDIFTALLNNANRAQRLVTHLKGSVRDIVRHGKALVIISDYGELVYIRPVYDTNGKVHKYDQQVLISDNTYNFRELRIHNNMAFALDCNGTLVKAPLAGKKMYTPVFLPASNMANDIWTHLFVTPEGNILAAGKHQMYLLDSTATKVLNTRIFDNEITCIGQHDNSFYVFDTKHTATTIDCKSLKTKKTLSLEADKLAGDIMAYHYVPSQELHVLGLSNGTLCAYSEKTKHNSIRTAHTSAITEIKDYGWCVVTASYDRTVRLWSLKNFQDKGIIVPSKVEYRTWPFAIESNTDQSILYIGLASGNVKTLTISVDKNAQETRNNITREFTHDEWDYFMGDNMPYRTFK